MNMVHLHRVCAFAMVGGLLAGSARLASAAPIVYEHFYDATSVPDAVSPGSSAYPKFLLVKSDGSASVSGGILTVTTTNDPINRNYNWAIGTLGGTPSSAWSADPTKPTAVEFKVKVASGATNRPFNVQVSDGANYVTVSFGAGNILLQNGAGNSGNITHDNTSFTTFRLDLFSGKVTLTDLDTNMVIKSDFAGTAIDRNALLFGDTGNSDYGTFELDYIKWTNNVPEPASLSLLALGGLLMIRRRRMRRPERSR